MQAKRRLSKLLLSSCFTGWNQVWEQRLWKTQLALREQQVQLMAAEVRHLEHRPVRYMRRYRLRFWFKTWVAYQQRKQAKRVLCNRTVDRCNRHLVRRAFRAWVARHETEAIVAASAGQAVHRNNAKLCMAALAAWKQGLEYLKHKKYLVERAEKHREKRLMRHAVGSWRYLTWFYGCERKAVANRTTSQLSIAFSHWQDKVQREKHNNLLCVKAQSKHSVRLCHWALQAWQGWVDGKLTRQVVAQHERWVADSFPLLPIVPRQYY